MCDWYRLGRTDTEVCLHFVPSENRFWPPRVMRDYPLPQSEVRGLRVTLTGPGAVWMYAHAAATFRAAGAQDICVRTPAKPGSSEDLSGSESLLILAGEDQNRGALLRIWLKPSPPLSPSAIHRLLTPRLEELSRLRPHELVMSGRATVDVYAQIAKNAIDSGIRRIACWSARDGLIVVYDSDRGQLGCQIARPDWLVRAMPRPVWPVIIGVTGDPNLGKSIFCNVLDSYMLRIGCDGWRLDCDGQSPTPSWYFSLVGDEAAKILREEYKRSWTAEMEEIIVDQLRRSRELFSVLIADLPGGNHKVTPPQRIPPGRERMFAELDAIILLDHQKASSEAAWREALQPYGLDRRIAAVLTSRDPQGAPSLSVKKDGMLWRGEVTGLDRLAPLTELESAFRVGLDELWQPLLDFARRRSADA